MTGIYTGDGRRDWVFYTQNLNIFGRVFNRALEPLEQMPLLIEAESDPIGKNIAKCEKYPISLPTTRRNNPRHAPALLSPQIHLYISAEIYLFDSADIYF